jgi:hypothetical protein
MSENVGALSSRNPKGLHGLYRETYRRRAYPLLPNYQYIIITIIIIIYR